MSNDEVEEPLSGASTSKGSDAVELTIQIFVVKLGPAICGPRTDEGGFPNPQRKVNPQCIAWFICQKSALIARRRAPLQYLRDVTDGSCQCRGATYTSLVNREREGIVVAATGCSI